MKRILIMSAVVAAVAFAASGCKEKYEFKLDEHIGICGGVSKADVAKDNGLEYVEASVSGFLMPEASEEEFEASRTQASESALPVYSANGFFPRDILVVGPEADLERAVAYSETAIRRASELGLKILVLGSSRSRTIPEGFDRSEAEEQFVTLLKRIAPFAEKYNIVIVIEPLQTQETNFINSVREGTAIAKRAGSPNICVLADFFHMARVGEDAGAIVEAGDMLRHCHIAECAERTAPGVDGDDFTPYFAALKKIKYTGCISFECGWKDIESQLPVAMEVMRNQINSVKNNK